MTRGAAQTSGRPPAAAGSAEVLAAIRTLGIELSILNDKVAIQAGLHPKDLDVLDVIDRDGSCTPSHLAARTGLRRATLTGILSRLESGGWLRRERDSRDGRSARVCATTRIEELRALYRPADALLDEALAGTTAGDRAMVAAVLGRLADLARGETPRPTPLPPRTGPGCSVGPDTE